MEGNSAKMHQHRTGKCRFQQNGRCCLNGVGGRVCSGADLTQDTESVGLFCNIDPEANPDSIGGLCTHWGPKAPRGGGLDPGQCPPESSWRREPGSGPRLRIRAVKAQRSAVHAANSVPAAEASALEPDALLKQGPGSPKSTAAILSSSDDDNGPVRVDHNCRLDADGLGDEQDPSPAQSEFRGEESPDPR